jgi:hypothetical protein
MAGREASFLDPEERAKLLKEMDHIGVNRGARSRKKSKTRTIEQEVAAATAAAVAEVEAAMHKTTGPPHTRNDNDEQQSGCFVCKLDNDHPNLLLCEGCNGEYHTYCLTPKLKAIPKDDWYCGT